MLLAGVMVAGSIAGSAIDAKSLTKPVNDALAAKGLTGVNATMTGREAIVTGPVADKDAAIAAAQGVYGVRWATFREGAGSAPAEAQLPTIDIRGTATGTTLTGAVPSEDVKTQLGAEAGRIFGTPVTNNLTVDQTLATPAWLTGLTGALPSLPKIELGSLSLTGPGGLRLSGQVPDAGTIDTIQAGLQSALPGISTTVDLTAPIAVATATPTSTPTPAPTEAPTSTPAPTPSTPATPALSAKPTPSLTPAAEKVDPSATIDATGSGVTVTATVPSQGAKDTLLAQAKRIFGGPITDKVKVVGAAAGSRWFDGFLGALPKLPAIKGGKLTATGDGLSLTGRVGSAAAVDSATKLLADAVPVPASVKLTAPSPKPTPAAVPADVVKAINGTTVWYPTASFELSQNDKKKLDRAIANLKKYKSITVEVDGYVSLPHNEATRLSFSKARAQSVTDYLVAGGIDAKRITAVGKGAANPIASNDTEAGRLKNQRATLVVKES